MTLRVLANELIETLDDPADADALTRRYLDGQPLTAAEREALSPPAGTVSRLLDGVTPAEAAALYATLPAAFRQDLAAISPASHIDNLRARLLVMHDRHDRLVPAAESRRLRAAAGGRGNDVRYTEVLAFEHVRPEGGLWAMLREGARLYRHMYDIIRIAQ